MEAHPPKQAASGVELRGAATEDALCLCVLGMQVFLDTYATDGIRPELAREVLVSFWQAKFAEAITYAGSRIVVAEREGHLIGFAQVTLAAQHELAPAGVQAELLRLYVQEPFTGAHVGTRLLAAAETFAASAGVSVLWLTSWVHNHRALVFYVGRGYEDCGMTYFTFQGQSYENRLFAKRLTSTGAA